MLTIAGSGINFYSLEELSGKVNWGEFDCLIADLRFNAGENSKLIPQNIEKNFLPFKEVKGIIKDKLQQNKRILYIVTGSPLFFSATFEIIRFLEAEMNDFKADKVNILPAESSRDYLLRKLRTPDNEVTSISLHGRGESALDLTKFLSTKYTFVLCDEFSLKIIADNTEYIKDGLIYFMGSKLGSPEEKIEPVNLHKIAQEMTLEEIKQSFVPYVLLIERKFEPSCSISDNEEFETSAGMLTKTDKRAITLQALELKSNLLMWDIGAGAGSVSIYAYKVFRIKTLLFEKNKEQCDFIKRNLSAHKVAGTQLFEGNALENYANQPKPDRIFIGGGGEEVLKKVKELYNELNEQGILVANIIGLENLAEIVQTLKNTGLKHEVRSIDITNFRKITGQLSIPEPERTLFQIVIKKGG